MDAELDWACAALRKAMDNEEGVARYERVIELRIQEEKKLKEIHYAQNL